METRDFELLKKLSEAFAPTGEEEALFPMLIEEIKPYVTKLYMDRMGNLIAEKGNHPDLLFCAHMDEVGFMITEICEDGSLHFDQLGGVDPAHLASKRVIIGSQKIPGVICARPVHFSRKEKGYTPNSYADLTIDIGCQSREEAEKLVGLGDNAVFDTEFSYLDACESTVKGKALDDRLGCFYLCRMIRDPEIQNAVFAFTVQEESGLRGAHALAESKKFSFGVAVDSTTASDLPQTEGIFRVCAQGKGGVLSYLDGASIYDHDLIDRLFQKLESEQIPIQTKTLCAGGNDASSLQKAVCGAKAFNISTPCRYIHGSVATARVCDLEAMQNALSSIYQFLNAEKSK